MALPPKRKTQAELDKDRNFQDAATLAQIIRERTFAERYEESLKDFLKAAWPVIAPGSPFADNWHIDCLCEHMSALFRRDIRRLIINIAPRSLKSSVISIAAPAWRWLKAPEERFLCASYSRALSLQFSRKTRNLIASPWYQQRWKEKFALAADQNEKGRFENDKGGARIAASVEGGVLGEGGSVFIIDDPNDLSEMSSQIYRQSVKDWYSNSASSRNIDPKTDVKLVVQQRASYGDDLTAFLLELGGWEQLVIPYEWDSVRRISSIGWTDPRTHMGELMHPARIGAEEIAQLKIEQRMNYSGQFQQNPASDTGGGLKKEWFKFYNPPGVERLGADGEPAPVIISLPNGKSVSIKPVPLPDAFEQVVASWDMAFKDAECNDYVAGQAWGRIGANSFMLARDRAHRNFPETLNAVRRMAIQFPCPEKLVEDKANGSAVIATLKNEIPGLIPVNPEGGKWSRVAAISGYVEAGNVYLPNPDSFPWVWDLLNEFADGRAAKHDDDTDAMTQALKRLYDSMANQGVPEFRVQPRLGEPQTACHIARADNLPIDFRRFISIVPNRAALWLVETPSGALRVVQELEIEGMDALTVGREIATRSLGDSLARLAAPNPKASIDMLMPKLAFAPIEPIGSWAELLEQGVLTYESEEGDWDARNRSKEAIRNARFRSEMVEEEDSALDRLRSLLAFQPPDFALVPYSRQRALALAEESLERYADYMSATEGEVRGEWPKLKISPNCPRLIAELGGFRRDKLDEAPSFVMALLLGVSAPRRIPQKTVNIQDFPVRSQLRNGTLFSRKFGTR